MSKKRHGPLWKKAYSPKRAEAYAFLMKVAVGKIHGDMLGTVLEAMPFERGRRLKILELGIGTGKLASRVLHQFPNAELRGLDGSPAMLEKAKAALRRYGKRVSYLEGDFGRREWEEGLPVLDAVISTAAVHHLSAKAKAGLFRRMFKRLKPGGVLIIGDAIRPRSAELRKKNDLAWASYIQRRLKTLKGEHRTLSSILGWIDSTRKAEGDKPDGLEEQMRWMKDAGFSDVDCFWKYFGFAVFGGVK